MNTLNFIEDVGLLARSMGALILAVPEETEGIAPQSSYTVSELIPKRVFLFDYEEDNGIDLVSEVTEHYMEDNSLIGDGINNKPEIISTTGFVGELTTRIQDPVARRLRQEANKLTLLSAYAPRLTETGLLSVARAERIYRDTQIGFEVATEKWKSISDSSSVVITGNETPEELSRKIREARNQTNQQKAFQELYSYWKNKQLFTVRTPWAVFRNCAIVSIAPRQENSRHVTSFAIKFQAFRMAPTETIYAGQDFEFNPNDAEKFLKEQGSPLIDRGTTTVGPNIGGILA